MNTQKGFFIALLLTFFFPSFILANDGVSNSALWIHSNNLITCVSVENLDEVNANGDMLVFDYSQTAGVQKGKPWTIAEKGKCYEINSLPPTGEGQNSTKSGELFLFAKPSIETRNKLADYGSYKSSDSVVGIFGDSSNMTCGQSTDPNYFEYNPNAEACWAMPQAVEIFPYGLGFNIDNLIRFTNVSIDDILNTNYTFGDGVSGFSSSYSDEGRAYVESSEVSQIRGIHQSLATEAESVIEKCDIRTREEVRLTFNEDSHGRYDVERRYISRYKDGTDKELSYDLDYQDPGVSAIRKANYYLDSIGCKAEVVTFLESKSEEVTKINKLVDSLKVRFENTQEREWYLRPKTESEKIELANFYKKTMPKSITSDDSGNVIPEGDKTELETPTLREKLNVVSGGNIMKIYWLLPLAGLIIILFLLFIRKRK